MREDLVDYLRGEERDMDREVLVCGEKGGFGRRNWGLLEERSEGACADRKGFKGRCRGGEGGVRVGFFVIWVRLDGPLEREWGEGGRSGRNEVGR